MMPAPRSSNGLRHRGRRRWWGPGGALALAGVAHAALLGGATAAGIGSGWGGLGRPAEPAAPAPRVRPLVTTCQADAYLAASVRALACASPLADDGARCVAELRAQLVTALVRCNLALSTVEFQLAPVDVDQLAQIDPEPLLETLREDRQRQFEQAQTVAQAAQAAAVVQQQQQRRPEDQVVEVARPDLELAPDRARFVSEYNQQVDRETVARGSNREEIARRSQAEQLEVKDHPREASTPKPPEPGPASDRPDAPRAPGMLSMRSPGVTAPSEIASDAHRRGTTAGTAAPVADGLRGRRGDGLIDQREVVPDEQRGQGGGGGGGAPPVDLRPSREVLERALGGGSVDHLDGIAAGDETLLNTRQWVHASFFNRLKRRVHQTWDPVSIWRRHDPHGTVYGHRTRVTRVRVSLDPRGALARIIVVSPSGVDVLDDEALRAFRAAQPFPHPPGALVGADGLITFDFGFHLEVGGGATEWRLFR